MSEGKTFIKIMIDGKEVGLVQSMSWSTRRETTPLFEMGTLNPITFIDGGKTIDFHFRQVYMGTPVMYDERIPHDVVVFADPPNDDPIEVHIRNSMILTIRDRTSDKANISIHSANFDIYTKKRDPKNNEEAEYKLLRLDDDMLELVLPSFKLED